MNNSNLAQQIRNQIKQKRQSLTSSQRHQAEQQITQQALALIQQKQAKNIALYLSMRGEVSTELLIKTLWQAQLNVYLPVLHPFSPGHLLFLAYQPDSQLVANRFNILEPKLNVAHIIPLDQLDIIFTPLVAFDSQGNRLGMGGGFYDRILSNWQQKNFIPVGLAYQCQQVEQLPCQPWDIPLAKILVG